LFFFKKNNRRSLKKKKFFFLWARGLSTRAAEGRAQEKPQKAPSPKGSRGKGKNKKNCFFLKTA
jgi:hypothetical protein